VTQGEITSYSNCIGAYGALGGDIVWPRGRLGRQQTWVEEAFTPFPLRRDRYSCQSQRENWTITGNEGVPPSI